MDFVLFIRIGPKQIEAQMSVSVLRNDFLIPLVTNIIKHVYPKMKILISRLKAITA